MISIFLNLLRFVLCPKMCSILENIPCAPESMYILLLWSEMLSRYQLNPFDLVCHLKPVSLLIFCLDDLSIEINGVLKSLTMTVFSLFFTLYSEALTDSNVYLTHWGSTYQKLT